MKKFVALILSLVLCLSTFGALADTTYLILGTGGTSGTYYALGGDIAALWMANIKDLDVSAQATKASKANIMSIKNKEMEIGFSQNDTMFYAYNGDQDNFGGEKVDDFVAIGALYPEAVQIVVSADSDIKTVADLKGRNVSVGASGSGTYINAMQILAAAGLTIDDIKPHLLSFSESADSFQNKMIDACFITAGVPNPAILEIANKGAVRLLTLEGEQMKSLQEKYPFYVALPIAKGTYNGIEEDVIVPSTMAVLICSKDLSEDLVYEMTKVLFEKTGDLSHAKKAEISVENATNGVPVPFHPGAAKYYAEKGITVNK